MTRAGQFAAIVLAAGRSARMGEFKPLLPFGDSSVVGHVVAQLRNAGISQIFAVIGHRADDMRAALAPLGVTTLLNPDVDRGMFESVRIGIAALPARIDACMLWPVDVPLVRAATLDRLLDAAADKTALSVHPTFAGKRGHPLILARPLFDSILHADGDGGLRAVLAAHAGTARDVTVIDSFCRRDMDTQADYEEVRTALANRHVPDDAECAAIWATVAGQEVTRRHSAAVATVARELAERLSACGVALDIALVEAGALLHDITKSQPHHDAAGAVVLRDFGFPAVADIVAQHSNLTNWRGDLDEAAVVFLADKLVLGEQRVTLAERFASARSRFRDDPAALAAARQRFERAAEVLRVLEMRMAAA